MRYADLRKFRDQLIGPTSAVLRQLGFAGIALVWIFDRVDFRGSRSAAFFIVLSLLCDLLQYGLDGVVLGVVSISRDAKGASDDEVVHLEAYNWLIISLVGLKTVLLAIGYVKIVQLLYPYTGSDRY